MTITGDALTLVPQPSTQNNLSGVAIVTTTAPNTAQVTAKSVTRTNQNEMVFSGSAVIAVPGQTPVTITGDELTLPLQK